MSQSWLSSVRLPVLAREDAERLQRVQRETLRRINAAARATATEALQVSQSVESHQHSRAFTSLSTTAFSIFDVYSGPDDSNEINLLGQAEAESRNVEERFGRHFPTGREWGQWAHAAGSDLAYRIRQRFVTFTAAPVIWLYLLTLGVATAAVGAAVEVTAMGASAWRSDLVASLPPVVDYIVWIGLCAVGAVLASAICQLGGAPQAEGSGIPYLKSLMAGTPLTGVLRLRVLLAKVAGLVAAQGGGLTIGREGPFVHMAGALAAQLWRLPAFARLSVTESRRRQLLAAAVAAGVTAVFGTPIGGVLFSIEVTSTYSLVSSQWMCFVCAVVCRLAFDAFASTRESDTGGRGFSFAVSIPTEFRPAQAWEMPFLALLGVVCGLLGSLFVFSVHKAKLTAKVLIGGHVHGQASAPSPGHAGVAAEDVDGGSWRAWVRAHWKRYAVCAVTGVLVASLIFPTAFLSRSDMDVLRDLFMCPKGMHPHASGSAAEIAASAARCPGHVWSNTSGAAAVASLATFLAIRFVTVVLSISLPIPCGMFQPLIVLGAAAGRLFGEVVAGLVVSQAGTAEGHGAAAAAAAAAAVQPGLYAVVGAAALVSGATHTVSTAVILFELTGQAVHLVPVLTGTLLAYAAAGAFTLPVYDVLMLASGLPYLPRVLSSASYGRTAGDAARPFHPSAVLCIHHSTYADALRLLTEGRRQAAAKGEVAPDLHATPLTSLPVVSYTDNSHNGHHNSMELLGSVSCAHLAAALSGAASRMDADDAALGTSRIQNGNSTAYANEPADLETSGLLDADGIMQSDKTSAAISTAVAPTTSTVVAGAGGVGDSGQAASVSASASNSVWQGVQSWTFAWVEWVGSGGPRPVPEGEEQQLTGPQSWMDAPLRFRGIVSAPSAVPGRVPGPVLDWDAAPLTIDASTPLARVHFLFALLLLPHVLVTTKGRLVGVLTKEDMCVTAS